MGVGDMSNFRNTAYLDYLLSKWRLGPDLVSVI